VEFFELNEFHTKVSESTTKEKTGIIIYIGSANCDKSHIGSTYE